ncbi:MAG TPA: hypothetical protein VFT85_02205 [Acidimicrobiia bacterium]|nr:hypothetical protein [Acidimicrobiia bacterium]
MPAGRSQRRAERRTKVAVLFADRTDRALDLLELLEMAWHDTFQEGTPPEDLIDDILLLSEGNLRLLIRWARIAITDWREVEAAAESARSEA